MFQFINRSKNWATTIILAIIIGLFIPSLIALASSVIGDNMVITNPTEQLRLGYDATNYSTFVVDSSNNLNITVATSTGYPFGIRFINNPDLVSDIPGSVVMGSSYNSIDENSPGSVISGGGFGGSSGETYKNYISKNALANIGGGHGIKAMSWSKIKDDPTHVSFYNSAKLLKLLSKKFNNVDIILTRGSIYKLISTPFFSHKIIALCTEKK